MVCLIFRESYGAKIANGAWLAVLDASGPPAFAKASVGKLIRFAGQADRGRRRSLQQVKPKAMKMAP